MQPLCIYASKNDMFINNLIFSKARLAPNQEICIPRLELLAGLIWCKMHKVCRLKIEQKHTWLDSQCVLNWIGSKMIFTMFVENRLKEIRSDREINFHYIASLENLADFASRGLKTKEIRNSGLRYY